MLLAGIVVLGFLLRLGGLSHPPRYDESYSYLFFASKPLWTVVSDYHFPNNHILNSLLMKLCVNVFGNHLWVIRLPALVFGLLLIPLGYGLARYWYGKKPALFAAFFIATIPVLSDFSTNGRGYTLLTALFIILILIGNKLLEKSSKTLWVGFVVVSILGFYTIPVFLYPFGMVCVWMYIASLKGPEKQQTSFFKSLILAVGVSLMGTVLVYSPVWLTSGMDVLIANDSVARLPFGQWLSSFINIVPLTLMDWFWRVPLFFALLLTVGLILNQWRFQAFVENDIARRFSILLTVVVCIVPIVIIQQVAPRPQTWIFLLPLCLVMAAPGVVYLLDKCVPSWVSGKNGNRVITIFLVVMSLWQGIAFLDSEAMPRYLEHDLLEAVDVVEQNQPQGVRIALPESLLIPLEYHLQQTGRPYRVIHKHWNLSVIQLDPGEHASSLTQMILPNGMSPGMVRQLITSAVSVLPSGAEPTPIFQTSKLTVYAVIIPEAKKGKEKAPKTEP